MSSAVVAASKMEVSTKGAHWTVAQVEARHAATKAITRKTKVVLRCPAWLKAEDKQEARAIWNRVTKQAADLELLDNLDADMLAIYCDAVARYQETGKSVWARLVMSYADRLGLTPAARARLAQKRAVEIVDEFGDEFDG